MIEFWVVELKRCNLILNSKPIYYIDYMFFDDVKKANSKIKEIKKELNINSYNSTQHKIKKFKLKKDFFVYYRIEKCKCITNDVEHNFYSLIATLNKVHENYGTQIKIEKQFDVEFGKKLKEYIDNL